jgi:hypothetical protein
MRIKRIRFFQLSANQKIIASTQATDRLHKMERGSSKNEGKKYG